MAAIADIYSMKNIFFSLKGFLKKSNSFPLTGKSIEGFSLVELMIAVVICTMITAGIYTMYSSQQESYLTQEQVADAQQNLRAAMYFITNDVRMACYDPTENADPAFLIANIAEMQFQTDRNEDGDFDNTGAPPNDTNEVIRYALTNDSDRDGIADGFPCALGVDVGDGNGLQPVAENVEALEFLYHLSSDASAPRDRNSVATQQDRDEIRSIDISLLVRSENPAKRYINTNTYTTASGTVWGPFGDHFRRRLLVKRIKCRNMGLQ